MGAKLDKLLETLTLSSAPASSNTSHAVDDNEHLNSTPAADATPAGSSTARPAHPAGPSYYAGGNPSMSLEEFTQRELDCDKFTHSHIGNKLIEHSVTRTMCKPYMYVSREGAYTQKQKLDIRHSVSAIEYIDTTLSLLADKRAFVPDDYNHIMYHLRKVTRDATERP